MAVNIYVYCPSDAGGPSRGDLEEELEAFFGGAAEDCGAGAGLGMFNLDYELSDGEDPHAWADRLKPFLAGLGVAPGLCSTCFPTVGNRARSGGGSRCSVRTAGGPTPPAL